MRKYGCSLSLLAMILLASSAGAQSLWNGTDYGMTVEQVKAVLPSAIRPLEQARLHDGSEELLRVEHVTVVNEDFSASFYFNAGKLKQVTLSLEERRDFDATMRLFDSLAKLFRVKYGPEIDREIQKGILNTANSTWLSGRTNITLFASGVRGRDDTVLHIIYQTRIASEADKLGGRWGRP